MQEEIEKDTLSRRAQLRAQLKDVEAVITQTLASSLKTSMPASAAEAAQQPLAAVQQVEDADLPGVLGQATGDSLNLDPKKGRGASLRGGASLV